MKEFVITVDIGQNAYFGWITDTGTSVIVPENQATVFTTYRDADQQRQALKFQHGWPLAEVRERKSASPKELYKPLGNARAEAHFVASGLGDEWRPVVYSEAHYIMNHTSDRFSDAAYHAIQTIKRDPIKLGSKIALGHVSDIIIAEAAAEAAAEA